MIQLTDDVINAAIDAISGYIVSVVSSETDRSIEEVSEAFLLSETYALLSDKETGYYWDSILELINKFRTEFCA